MPKLIITCLAISLGFFAHAQKEKCIQQLNFHLGKNFSSLLYKNDIGEKDSNMSYTSGQQLGIGIGIGLGSRHLIRPEIVYSEFGAKSSFQSLNINWKMNYMGIGANYLYNVMNKSSFSFSSGIRIGLDYLLKGEQTIGSARYNIKEIDAIKAWDINAGAILNGRYKITEKLYLLAEYRFAIGLNQIEKKDVGEKTRNIGHSTLLGLSFNL